MTDEDSLTDEDRGSSRAVVCDACSRLISLADVKCPYCGAIRAGAPASLAVRKWLRGRSLTNLFLAANIVMYVVSLALTGRSVFDAGNNLFDFLGPSGPALDFLGLNDPHAVLERQEYWRLLTAAFLHLGLIHIVFNGMAIRSLGHTLEELFGSARFAIVYLGSAIVGNLAIAFAGAPAAGASGAIFGLLGGGLAFGFRRGGTFGQLLRGEFGRWVLYNVIFTFAVPGISIAGHLGGLAGGFVLGWLLTPGSRRSAAESAAPPWLTLLAGFLLILVPVSFGASVVNGLFFRRGTYERFLGGDPGAYAIRNVVLTPRALNDIGLTNWVIDVPGAWKLVHRSPEAVQWATPHGVVLTIFRVNPVEDDASAVLRQASGTASWTEIEGTRSAGADRAAADYAPKPGTDELKGARRRLEVRRANAAWIGVASDRRGDVDDAAWRQFFARVLESIRKA